jgi:hypothetical protein
MWIIVEVVTFQILQSFSGSSHSGGVIQDPALLFASTLAQPGSHFSSISLLTVYENTQPLRVKKTLNLLKTAKTLKI